MQILKEISISFIVLAGLLFFFRSEVLPEDFQIQEILKQTSDNDVIIIFNSGGWGNTPIDQAEDFAPVIEGVQKTLEEWGYNSFVIPYNRTRDNLSGKIFGAKEIFNSFRFSSDDLAEKIETLNKNLPDKKIIIAGLSAGGSFVNEVYEKISDKAKDSVYAIAAGAPFWSDISDSENILQLDNSGKDILVKGEISPLLSSLIKAPFKWIRSKLTGGNLTFSQSLHFPEHDYPWSSPSVSAQIITFLDDKLK